MFTPFDFLELGLLFLDCNLSWFGGSIRLEIALFMNKSNNESNAPACCKQTGSGEESPLESLSGGRRFGSAELAGVCGFEPAHGHFHRLILCVKRLCFARNGGGSGG